MASVRNNGVATSRAPYTPGSDEHVTTFVYEYDRGSRLTSVSDPADSAKTPSVSGRRRGQRRSKPERAKSRGRRGSAE